MISVIAEAVLEGALVVALAQAIFGQFARPAAVTLFICITFCFAALVYSFVVSDFSLKLVFENSHTLKPFIYKISGTWGNHEGSLLMLLWILSAYGFAYSFKPASNNVLRVHGAVTACFVGFTIFASNPFEMLPIIPPEGMGLNPVLQDIGLALHPPTLYAGYIGFAIIYAIAIASLFKGELIKGARNWCFVAWGFLTLGIALGSWWAYRELGWGGFWFWDPVENASLMPWLSGTALLHSLMIRRLDKWSVLLAIITFSLSVLGFFLVRSGVLTSVHAFASDPTRGVIILCILALISGGGFTLFGARAHKLKIPKTDNPRAGYIKFNNLLLSVLCVTVVIGTLYPLILAALGGESISVGPPYFAKTFVPIALPLIGLVAFVTYLWGRKTLTPMLLSHVGFLVLVIGVAAASYFAAENELAMKEGEAVQFAGYKIEYKGREEKAQDNYLYRRASFNVWDGNREVAILKPETRFYPVENERTTESSIYRSWFSDLYIVIGELDKNQEIAVRLYHKPLINLIWLGALLMFLSLPLKLIQRKI